MIINKLQRIHQMNDNDLHKGAFEEDDPRDKGQSSLKGQLSHRDQNPMIKASDTDFPEPGENPEHSGEPEEQEDPEGEMQDQDPGHRQKHNQGNKGEDPLAA